MKTISTVISIIAVAVTGCAHTGYQSSYGGYGSSYGGYGYGSGYSVERYYGSPAYNYNPPAVNYYYVTPPHPRPDYDHGHDRDRYENWRNRLDNRQHQQTDERREDNQRNPGFWGRSDHSTQHGFGHQQTEKPFSPPARTDDQNHFSGSEGGHQGRRGDNQPTRRDNDQSFGRHRD